MRTEIIESQRTVRVSRIANSHHAHLCASPVLIPTTRLLKAFNVTEHWTQNAPLRARAFVSGKRLEVALKER